MSETDVRRDAPEWMKPVDTRILELLEQTKSAKLDGLWMKGATIAVNLEVSKNYVNKRLRKLAQEGYVEKLDHQRGYYRISDTGTEFVRS